MADPTENGSYAAEVYFGWKLLDWHGGHWHHPGLVGGWPLEVVQWVKLPDPVYFKIEDARNDATQEYDL